MKKIISLTCGVALCSCFVLTAFATDYTIDAATGAVTVDTANTDATVDVIFNPSAQVVMSGASEQSAFAHGAYHAAVVNKASGKEFAMASDSSAIYYLDISPDGIGAAVSIAGSTNTADVLATSNGNWHTM